MKANNELITQIGDSQRDPEDHHEDSGQKSDDLLPDVGQKSAYAFAKEGELYVAYLSNTAQATLDLRAAKGEFTLHWFDPLNGGKLQTGSNKTLLGGRQVSFGQAPSESKQDWVVLVRRIAQ